MSLLGLNTYIINSHGDACSPGEAVDLPKNVFVIMNCSPTLTNTNHLLDAFLWKLACKYNLRNSKFSNLDMYKKYIGSLLINIRNALHHEYALTEFCLFTEKCPNIQLNFNENKFRTGLFQLPASIKVKDTSLSITADMLDTYIQRMRTIADLEQLVNTYEANNRPQNANRITQDINFYEGFYGRDEMLVHIRQFLTNQQDKFVVEGKMEMNVQDLNSLVQNISNTNKDSLHFIIVNACRENAYIENEQAYKIPLTYVGECVKQVVKIVTMVGGKRTQRKQTVTPNTQTKKGNKTTQKPKQNKSLPKKRSEKSKNIQTRA